MISSGTKRGLAAVAVSALAVAGLPFLASSASADTGDEFQFVAAGPTRNSVDATAIGGFVVLKSKAGTVSAADAQSATTGIKAIGTDLTSPANNASQTVSPNLAGIQVAADDASNPFGGLDGYDEIYVPVKVFTPTAGSTANYALYLDDNNSGTVQATEPRAAVTQSTSGAPASISVDPASQTAASGAQSGNYVGTVKDSAGRTTQLLAAGEALSVVPDADTQIQLVTTPASAEGAAGAPAPVSPIAVAQRR
jgi:hypothetical protein